MPLSKADILRMSDYDMRNLTHAQLVELRDKKQPFAYDVKVQNRLAPYEHADFVRDATRDNPIVGAAAIPFSAVYNAGKALRQRGADWLPKEYFGGRSTNNAENFAGALRGFREGLGITTAPDREDWEYSALIRQLRGGS